MCAFVCSGLVIGVLFHIQKWIAIVQRCLQVEYDQRFSFVFVTMFPNNLEVILRAHVCQKFCIMFGYMTILTILNGDSLLFSISIK